MGQRSYLYLKNKSRSFHIFEANNALPFFWISLLDRQTFKNKIPDWEALERYEATHTEEETESDLEQNNNSITVSEAVFDINSANSRKFLQKHFPETIPLFDDFIRYIKSKFETGDCLEMDIIENAAFHNSLTAFCDAIDHDLKAIETNRPDELKFLIIDDLIGCGTGFESVNNNEFSSFPTYQEALKKRAKPTVIRQENKFSAKALIIYLIMLLLCPLFSFLGYKMFRKEGFTFFIALLAVLNIGFYWFCIFAVIAEVKAFRTKK